MHNISDERVFDVVLNMYFCQFGHLLEQSLVDVNADKSACTVGIVDCIVSFEAQSLNIG